MHIRYKLFQKSGDDYVACDELIHQYGKGRNNKGGMMNVYSYSSFSVYVDPMFAWDEYRYFKDKTKENVMFKVECKGNITHEHYGKQIVSKIKILSVVELDEYVLTASDIRMIILFAELYPQYKDRLLENVKNKDCIVWLSKYPEDVEYFRSRIDFTINGTIALGWNKLFPNEPKFVLSNYKWIKST